MRWVIRSPALSQQRLDAKTDKSGGPDACWLWTGATNGRGYGSVSLPGGNVAAHILAWALTARCSPISGLVVRHSCDCKRCVNPAHLALGTHRANTRDAMERGRFVPLGHKRHTVARKAARQVNLEAWEELNTPDDVATLVGSSQ